MDFLWISVFCCVAAESDGGPGQLLGGVNALLIQLDFLCVEVKADNIHMLGKGNRDGHTDIAEADKGQFFFFCNTILTILYVFIESIYCDYSCFMINFNQLQ